MAARLRSGPARTTPTRSERVRSPTKEAAAVLRYLALKMEKDDPLAAVQLDDLAYRLLHHRGQGRRVADHPTEG